MAVGTFTLPICDLCKLPWLPVGWTQDSHPRSLPAGVKPLRCGKCKTAGWDREHVAQAKQDAAIEDVGSSSNGRTPGFDPADAGSSPAEPTSLDLYAETRATAEAQMPEDVPRGTLEMPPLTTRRCKHRMTNCPICNPKEAA